MKNRIAPFLMTVITAALVSPVFTAGTAQAIPAFTRQHKTECFTCHTVFPELTEQGENFKKNSFVWLETKGDKKETIKEEKKDGKKGLNEREYLTLSSLPDFAPVSVSAAFNGSFDDKRPDDGNKLDFVTRAVVLQAAGSFNDKMGFWLSYNLYTEGPFDPTLSNAPGNNQPNLNDAFFQARHIFGTPVNFKLGRMRPTLSLWKGTNKTSVQPIATTSYRVGESTFFTDAAADGIEVNSILGRRVFAAAGTVKRKNQENLEGYGSVQVRLGGADFEGREAPISFDSESIFDYLTLTLGGYGYAGTNNIGAQKQANHYYRFGFESDARYQRYRLKLATAFGVDDNAVTDPAIPAGPWINRDSQVISAEAQYLVGSNIIPSFRYEYQDDGAIITRRYIPSVAYAPLQNAKVVLEYKHEVSPVLDRGMVNVAFVAAF